MEFLKDVGRGLLMLVSLLAVVAGMILIVILGLEFNEWLYYNHRSFWSIFWKGFGFGLLVIALAVAGGKNREWTGG